MNPVILFSIVQGISIILTILILWKYIQEQKDRHHVFSQLGHNGFSEHLTRGKILGIVYAIGTIVILLSTTSLLFYAGAAF